MKEFIGPHEAVGLQVAHLWVVRRLGRRNVGQQMQKEADQEKMAAPLGLSQQVFKKA